MRRYIKLHTAIRTNPKFLGLPSAEAKLACILAFVAAKETEPEGEWLNRGYFMAAVPEAADWLDVLILHNLLVEDEDETIRVPQWAHWNGADKNARQIDVSTDMAERKRAQWRRQKAAQRQRMASGHEADMSANVHPNRERKREIDMSTVDSRLDGGCVHCGLPVDLMDEVVIIGDGGKPASLHKACIAVAA